mgnify:CR=1 FL=1
MYAQVSCGMLVGVARLLLADVGTDSCSQAFSTSSQEEQAAPSIQVGAVLAQKGRRKTCLFGIGVELDRACPGRRVLRA